MKFIPSYKLVGQLADKELIHQTDLAVLGPVGVAKVECMLNISTY